jgi:hypothetical protein
VEVPYRAGPAPHRRIKITRLPAGCTWRELKDMGRKFGEINYTDVRGSGSSAM